MYRDTPIIEGSWNQRPHGIRGYTHLDAKPSWVSGKAITDKPGERPISVYTALSELRFVSDDDDDTASPTDPGSHPSPCSPISQIHFASPEEIMTPLTPTEFRLRSRDSPLSSPAADFYLPVVREDLAQMTPSEQSPLTAGVASVSPQQPRGAMRRLDGFAISDSKKVAKRPLPEVPGQPQSRPLPPRPVGMAMVPGRWGPSRSSYPPFREFDQGSSKDHSTASRPASDSGIDTRSQSMEERRPTRGPTFEGTPLIHHTPAPPAIISPAFSSPYLSPSPPSTILPSYPMLHSRPPPSAISTTSVPHYPTAPIPLSWDLVSPTSINLITAAGLKITGENGENIFFGDLFKDRKTIVIFIRYFWCLFCEDYVRSISNCVTPEILKNKGVDLILIGNGTPGMMKSYKSMSLFAFRGP